MSFHWTTNTHLTISCFVSCWSDKWTMTGSNLERCQEASQTLSFVACWSVHVSDKATVGPLSPSITQLLVPCLTRNHRHHLVTAAGDKSFDWQLRRLSATKFLLTIISIVVFRVRFVTVLDMLVSWILLLLEYHILSFKPHFWRLFVTGLPADVNVIMKNKGFKKRIFSFYRWI